MRAATTPGVRRIVFKKSAQVGATEVLNNIVGYFIHWDPCPILVVQPSSDPMAKAWSKDRLAPMIRDTTVLRDLVAEPKSRDSDNTVLHKTFPGGSITITGANSPSGLASRFIRVVGFDEVDRYPPSAGNEGDPVALGVARTQTFHNALIFEGSTPTDRGLSRIDASWEESNMQRYYVPCPECGAMQYLQWKQVVWNKDPDETDPILRHLLDTVHYQCEHCNALLSEWHKRAMLEHGEWRAERPQVTDTYGFHINALYSPWKTWRDCVREFVESKRDRLRLKTWVNTVLGEVWEEAGEYVPVGELNERREHYAAEVPRGVGVLTCGVDVQKDRVEYAVKGWGVGQESWLIDHGRLYGEPEGVEVWERLLHVLRRPYAHELGVPVYIRATCIDSGFSTTNVYAFVKPNEGVYATKGLWQKGHPILGRPPKKPNRYGVKVFPLGVDTAKDVIFARLKQRDPGPGFMHFPPAQPDRADHEYLKQFGAEKQVIKYKHGVAYREYEQVRDRNDAIDMEVYALAALHVLGAGVYEHLDHWVDAMAELAAETATTEVPRAEPDASTDDADVPTATAHDEDEYEEISSNWITNLTG